MPAKSSQSVRLAIIGTGGMAHRHAQAYTDVPGCRVIAVADLDASRAKTFAETYQIPEVYGSTRELLQQADIDAVSVVVPDPYHAAVSIECLKAGKHVLCEKPLALNHKEARRMVAAAKRAGVINMVNFSYRDLPCIQKVATIVRSGKLGELRHVEASYHQGWLVSRAWGDWRTSPAWLWRLSSAHGSKGALGDIGVHILDFATYPAGPIRSLFCQLTTFSKAPGDRVGAYHLDANDTAVINVGFATGAVGSIQTTRWLAGHPNRLFLKMAGTKGSIEIDSERDVDGYRICTGRDVHTNTWRTVSAKPVPNMYQRFVRSVRSGKQEQPDFARGAEVQRVLDACFASDAAQAPVTVPSERRGSVGRPRPTAA